MTTDTAATRLKAAPKASQRKPLSGEVAIITGASGGIGSATARELARQGARVVLAARRAEELEALAHEITDAGGEALVVPTDVAARAQLEQLVAKTTETYGRIDILINNAGIGTPRPLAQQPPEFIDQLLEVDLVGLIQLTRLALPGMLERKHGAIISVASVAGHIGLEPLYSAAKFGVRGFSLSLRRQLRGSGVSVSLVSPGFIRTPMTRGLKIPMPGPAPIARAVARLVRRPRREVVVPRFYRVPIWIDRYMPWLVDLLVRPGRGTM
jgi:NAD(P)-dependent dehydrogenase (short-subunit alcohol dehydrogenase family)